MDNVNAFATSMSAMVRQSLIKELAYLVVQSAMFKFHGVSLLHPHPHPQPQLLLLPQLHRQHLTTPHHLIPRHPVLRRPQRQEMVLVTLQTLPKVPSFHLTTLTPLALVLLLQQIPIHQRTKVLLLTIPDLHKMAVSRLTVYWEVRMVNK